ncbi:hypothetical protein EYF80_012251 [Liparis tanakae]|uniref:Uncharacterized protein n=1 Tax=Liparis tanakae TaxID=230148 RepID=A0A4Z2II37_9TELE|nr:hypothetical protein EYF80_012251 [Liparis tanakae]
MEYDTDSDCVSVTEFQAYSGDLYKLADISVVQMQKKIVRWGAAPRRQTVKEEPGRLERRCAGEEQPDSVQSWWREEGCLMPPGFTGN